MYVTQSMDQIVATSVAWSEGKTASLQLGESALDPDRPCVQVDVGLAQRAQFTPSQASERTHENQGLVFGPIASASAKTWGTVDPYTGETPPGVDHHRLDQRGDAEGAAAPEQAVGEVTMDRTA